MSLPYFPHQSVAQLPSWAQFGSGYSAGAGSVSYKVDSQGGDKKSCIFYRFALPQTKDISIEAHVVFRNKLVAVENGSEGLSVQIRGYRISGTQLQVIWSNDVINGGDQVKWAWENRGNETIRHTVVAQLPSGLNPDCIDVCIIIHAPGGGHVEIDNVELRNLYSRKYVYVKAIGNAQTLTVASTEILVNDTDDLVLRTYNYYLPTEQVLIYPGESVFITAAAQVSGSLLSFNSDHTIEIYILAKFRYRSGQFKTIKIAVANNKTTASHYNVNIIDQLASGTANFTATEEVNQVEYILSLEDTGLDSDPASSISASYREMDIEVKTTGRSSLG
jgi:hypothetical protein